MKSVVLGLALCLSLTSVVQAQEFGTLGGRRGGNHEGPRSGYGQPRHEAPRVDRDNRRRDGDRFDRRYHPRYEPRPGYYDGWRWEPYHRAPRWYHVGIVLPWVWINVPVGYWQCTAFNEYMQPISAVGNDVNQAAYNALYECGGANYEAFGCYIPQGYCQLR
jgi:hypothetical protein